MLITTTAHNVRATIRYTMAPSPFKGEADQTFTAPLFVDDRIFRLSAAHEQAWAARQTPVPTPLRRTIIYNMYFEYSERLARAGNFEQALSAFRRALQYLDDAYLRERESADIPRLSAIIQEVRAGRMTTARAKELWLAPQPP